MQCLHRAVMLAAELPHHTVAVLVCLQSSLGLLLVCPGLALACLCAASGPIWSASRLPPAYLWAASCLPLGCLPPTYGLPLVCLWQTPAYLWAASGLPMVNRVEGGWWRRDLWPGAEAQAGYAEQEGKLILFTFNLLFTKL